MHRAPALSFPVGRSRFQFVLLVLTGALGLLVGLFWYSVGDPPGWRQFLFFPIWLFAFGRAFRTWQRTASGCLHWDGQNWSVGDARVTVSGPLRVHLDLQSCMVLSLRPVEARPVWIFPERSADVLNWDGLRRAVFSASGGVPGHLTGAEADAAPR